MLSFTLFSFSQTFLWTWCPFHLPFVRTPPPRRTYHLPKTPDEGCFWFIQTYDSLPDPLNFRLLVWNLPPVCCVPRGTLKIDAVEPFSINQDMNWEPQLQMHCSLWLWVGKETMVLSAHLQALSREACKSCAVEPHWQGLNYREENYYVHCPVLHCLQPKNRWWVGKETKVFTICSVCHLHVPFPEKPFCQGLNCRQENCTSWRWVGDGRQVWSSTWM